MRCLLAVLVLCLPSIAADAGFVLDDFDGIDFDHQWPNGRQNGPEQWDIDVGPLSVRRWTNVSDRRLESATLSLSTTQIESVVVADVIHVPPPDSTAPLQENSSFSLYWDFILPGQVCPTCATADREQKDFTEDGINNTVFIDFAFIRGPTPPRTIRLSAPNGNNWALYHINDVASSEEPFTVAVPFADFRDRVYQEGVSLDPDFSRLSSFGIAVYSSGLFDTDLYQEGFEESFSVGIDAVRFGYIPEPTVSPAVFFLWMMLVRARRKRGAP